MSGFFVSSVIDRGPRARKRRGAVLRLVFLFFPVFLFHSFFFLFTLRRDSGGLRPELLVTRDSCVLRSPAGLKPDKDYHTLEMFHLPAASEGSLPLSRLISPFGNWHRQQRSELIIFRITWPRGKDYVYTVYIESL